MIIDNNDGTHTVRIDIIVKDTILEKNGIELFAQYFGWRAQVDDGQGNMIANPQSALDAGIAAIKKFTGDIFKEQLIRHEMQVAQEAAATEADNLLNS